MTAYSLDLAFRDKRGPLVVTPLSSEFDGHPWNLAIFEQRFTEIKGQIESQSGKLIYAPDVDPVKSPHFSPDDLQRQMASPLGAP